MVWVMSLAMMPNDSSSPAGAAVNASAPGESPLAPVREQRLVLRRSFDDFCRLAALAHDDVDNSRGCGVELDECLSYFIPYLHRRLTCEEGGGEPSRNPKPPDRKYIYREHASKISKDLAPQ